MKLENYSIEKLQVELIKRLAEIRQTEIKVCHISDYELLRNK